MEYLCCQEGTGNGDADVAGDIVVHLGLPSTTKQCNMVLQHGHICDVV